MTVFERAPALYLAAGALCGALVTTGTSASAPVLALLIALIVLLYRGRVRGGAAIFLAIFGITVLAAWQREPPGLDGPQDGTFTGLVESQHQGGASRRCIVSLHGHSDIRIALTVPDLTPTLRAGDSIRFEGTLLPVAHGTDTRGAITAANYALAERLSATATVLPDHISVTGCSSALPFRLDALRQRLSDLIHDTGLSPAAADLLASATLGTSEIAPDMVSCFRATGLAHLLCVSGFHLGVLAGIIGMVLLPMRYARPRLRLTIMVLFAWGYAALTGMTPAVTRAAIMLTAYSLMCALERRGSPLNGLALAFAFIVSWNPYGIYSAGFQLSFCAVAAIILYTDALNIAPSRHYRMRHYVEPLFVPAAAALGTLPVMLAWWGTVSIVSLPFNAIGATIFPIYMVGGIVAVLLWHAGIGGAAACSAVDWLYHYFSLGLDEGARLAEGVNLHVDAEPVTVWVCAAALVALAIAIYASGRRTRLSAIGMATAAAAVALYCGIARQNSSYNKLTIKPSLYGIEITYHTPDSISTLAPADIVRAGKIRILTLRHVAAPDSVPAADILVVTPNFRGDLQDVIERSRPHTLLLTPAVRRLPVLPDSLQVHLLWERPYEIIY